MIESCCLDMMEKFKIRTAGYGSTWPHVAVECLKRGSCGLPQRDGAYCPSRMEGHSLQRDGGHSPSGMGVTPAGWGSLPQWDGGLSPSGMGPTDRKSVV